jgi:hypothetical protein
MDSEKPALKIVPASEKSTKQCVVIPEGARPDIMQIIGAAAQNDAMVDNSDEEAGDDQFCVQFPGHGQELLERDALSARVEQLLYPDLQDE